MSARLTVHQETAAGLPSTGLNVDLYANGGAKVGDFTDNGDGSYYIDISTSGKYDVYVGGAIQDEFTGIYVAVDDQVTDVSDKMDKITSATGDLVLKSNGSGEAVESSLDIDNVLASGVHDTENGSGASESLSSNKVHHARAIQVYDITSNFGATKTVEQALKELAEAIEMSGGALAFSATNFLDDYSTVKDALVELDRKIREVELSPGSAGGAGVIPISIKHGANISSDTYLMPFNAPCSGVIAWVSAQWSSSSSSVSTSVDICVEDNIYGRVNSSNAGSDGLMFKNAYSSLFNVDVNELIRFQIKPASGDNLYLNSLIVGIVPGNNVTFDNTTPGVS